MRALLRQEVAFFENNKVEQMPSDIGQYFNTISLGIGENYAALIQGIGTFVGGIAISFYKGPVFASVCLAYFPVIMITMVFVGGANKRVAFLKLEANTDLGGYTEECLSALKLIIAFGNEDLTLKEYRNRALVTRDISKGAGKVAATFFGIFRAQIFCFFVYNYLIASIFVEEGYINPNTALPYSIVEVVSVTQCMIMSMMTIFKAITNV